MHAGLGGRRVLIAHPDAFQGNYLADVIGRAGATVVGPVVSFPDAIDQLDGNPPLSALAISDAMANAAALAQAAMARRVAVLLLRPARLHLPPPYAVDGVLTVPFSAFQVVEALGDLLRNRRR